jgi:hypothetical protein
LPFYASGYRINNNFNIGMLELDTRFSNSLSNKLTVGYSALRDFRSSLGDVYNDPILPFVDIGNGQGVNGTASAVATSFGYELYTAGNILYTNIGQFSDELSLFAGKHEFTFGTNEQIQSYKNGFAPDYYGLYTYNSVAAFEANPPVNAAAYTVRYPAVGNTLPYARIKASIYSAYAQDRYHITDNIRLTYGVRLDYDAFPESLPANNNVPGLTFQQGIHVNPAVLPKDRLQFSPRIGFNWDVNGDQSTQVRGGSGLFTGTIPFVWISNQASNNGVLFGSYTIVNGAASNTPAQNAQLQFNPSTAKTAGGAANTSYELDVANPNLKYPKILRNDIAVDQKLPWGIIGTLEGQYSKDINSIYHENLVLSDGYTVDAGPEGQIHYNSKNTTPAASAATAQNPSITGLYYMTNSNAGYSYFVTAQLQKSFQGGFYANVAYTHSGSKDINDGGSTASTIWSSRDVAGNPNAPNISNSSFVEPNRIIASLIYKKDYLQHASTSVGLIFEMANNGAVSYISSAGSNGDANGDGATNDLIYIPKNQSDIELIPDTKANPATAAQQWQQLSAFINQDKYLRTHEGEFAQRNGVIMPYFKRFDFKVTQDFYIMAGKTKNTLEFSLDIINVGNLLNHNWGVYQNTYTGINSGSVSLLKYEGIDAATKRPEYNFPLYNGAAPTRSFINDSSQLSRFQCQFGVRYIFN